MSWYHVLPKDFSSKLGHFFLVVILMALTGIGAYYYSAFKHTMTTLNWVMANGSYIKSPVEGK